MELSLTQLADLPEGSYLLIDTRDEVSYEYGTIEGAENVPDVIAAAQEGRLPHDRKLVLFCMHGIRSGDLASELEQMGYDACSLKGLDVHRAVVFLGNHRIIVGISHECTGGICGHYLLKGETVDIFLGTVVAEEVQYRTLVGSCDIHGWIYNHVPAFRAALSAA